MYDVAVIGAGPVGCRTAELIARRGFKVALIEKNAEVGLPVQCTGLISSRLTDIITDLPENVVLNRVSRARFFATSAGFELQSKRPFYVVDREKLDKFLFLRARQAGASADVSILFKDFERTAKGEEDFLTLHTGKGKVQARLLVGADGPVSTVAAKAGLERPANMLTGVQVTAAGEYDPDAVELIFSNELTPDFFGWVVPLGERQARIGVAARQNAVEALKAFVEKRTGGLVKAEDVKPDVAGKINFGLMERTSAERLMVVGDAACQVKPFSGGGVVYGLLGAGYCANAAVKALKSGDFSAEFLKQEYDDKWRAHLAKPIRRGMLYRRILFGSDCRMSTLFRVGKLAKPLLESFDADLL
ncbi:MAG: NAD(P)/FAD-dependent oxidoreductase [Candidatus Aenigmatarchaeota archaeon]